MTKSELAKIRTYETGQKCIINPKKGFDLFECPEHDQNVTSYECQRFYEAGGCPEDCEKYKLVCGVRISPKDAVKQAMRKPRPPVAKEKPKKPEKEKPPVDEMVVMTDGRSARAKVPYRKNGAVVLVDAESGKLVGKICKTCGKPRPVSDYHTNPASIGGVNNNCKDCRLAQMKKKYKPKDKKQEPKNPPIQEPKAPAPKKPAPAPSKPEPKKTTESRTKPAWNPEKAVLVDFHSRPELLKGLEKLADHNFRSPEQQVMFMVQEAMGFVANI